MTDADPATRFLDDLEAAAAGDGRVADARFQRALEWLALRRRPLLAALDTPLRREAFLQTARTALRRQRNRLLNYIEDSRRLAADRADDRRDALCVRRSALQFLRDDHAGTDIATWLDDTALAAFDTELRARLRDFGPVDPESRPDAIPEHHDWWRAPDAAGDANAGAAPLPNANAAATEADARVLAAAMQALVEPVLRALHGDGSAAVLAALRPRRDDHRKLFDASLTEAAERGFETLWAQPPTLTAMAPGSRLDIHAAPAGMLGHENTLSWPFPGGYRRLARYLVSQRVWVAWTIVEPGASSGVAYDGLVWIDDHWAWFPKPYRVLRSALDALNPSPA